MRALAYHSKSPRNHHGGLLRENVAAFRAARPSAPQHQVAPTFAEPPAETDAWWLSRSQAATFARRRITLSDACGRALRATEGASGRIVVEFNGASFEGATLAANEGRYELDLGEALAQEMADVLDEDDGLAIDLVAGRGPPTLAIQPYVGAGR